MVFASKNTYSTLLYTKLHEINFFKHDNLGWQIVGLDKFELSY